MLSSLIASLVALTSLPEASAGAETGMRTQKPLHSDGMLSETALSNPQPMKITPELDHHLPQALTSSCHLRHVTRQAMGTLSHLICQ